MLIVRWGLLAFLLAYIPAANAKEQFTPRAAFKEACRLSRYSCWRVPTPFVRVSVYVDRSEAYGIYMGGRTIWIAPSLQTAKERYVVMVHEMVHYLQNYVDQEGLPFDSKFEQCVREHEAFEVSDQVAKRLEMPDMVRGGNFVSYGCGVVTPSDD